MGKFDFSKIEDQKKKGFSLIEVISAIAIGAILLGVVAVSFASFRDNKSVDISVDQILSVINEARVKAVSAEDSSRFGVYFEAGQVTLFKGDSFIESDASNIKTTLSALAEISDVAFNGGGSSILFQKLTGKTANDGSLRIKLKSNNNKFKTIKIKTTGIVNVQ